MIYRLLLGLTVLMLGGCASPPSAFYGKDYCEAPPIRSPDGICNAYYKQFFGGADVGALLIVSCEGQGHGLTGYSGHAESGMALHWLSNDQLEIALPPGVTPTHQERDPVRMTGVTKPGVATDVDLSPVRVVRLSYRDLTPKDREWGRSCYARRPKDKFQK